MLKLLEVKYNRALEKRFKLLMDAERFNLNGSKDNAIAEALALSIIYATGHVLAERELVRVSGIGDVR